MRRRAFASWQVLAALVVLAVLLLFVQRSTAARDVDVATGPPNAAQRAFFESSASRPDLVLFFKALPKSKKLLMARNLGEHATASSAKIAAKLLSTFDEQARDTLIASLSKIAASNPDLVAGEIGQSGSFQRIGVFRALRSAGEKGIRSAAASLSDPARKSNAVRFLVELGSPSIPHVLPLLNDPTEATRAAAAEALGKLRATEAVGPILSRVSNSKGEEKSAYIAALSDIGDARAENELLNALQVAGPGEAARIMAGLGRIASTRSIERLVRIHREGSNQERDAALSGLVLAANRAFTYVDDPKLKLAIAARVRTPLAETAIRAAMSDSSLAKVALKAAVGREGLVEAVWPQEGEIDNVPLRIEVLASTKAGRRILGSLKDHPTFGGYAQRALELSTISEN